MLTKEEAEIRVALGAALLDSRVPRWAAHIDTGSLHMAGCNKCILGQLAMSFWNGIQLLFDRMPDSPRTADSVDVQHGFSLDPIDGEWIRRADYLVLQDAWIAAIADRLIPTTRGTPITTDAVHESRDQPELTPRV
jgi:hypothetical protein